MTPDTQKEFLTVLGEVSQLAPDVRLGQLLAHLGFLGESHLGRGLPDLEDDEMLALLYRHRGELRARGDDTEKAAGPTPSVVSVSGSVASVGPAAPVQK